MEIWSTLAKLMPKKPVLPYCIVRESNESTTKKERATLSTRSTRIDPQILHRIVRLIYIDSLNRVYRLVRFVRLSNINAMEWISPKHNRVDETV